jgi:hypothetical protein
MIRSPASRPVQALTEGPDAEVVADWSRRTAAVADLVDLVEVRHCVATHRASCIVVLGNPGYELEASD